MKQPLLFVISPVYNVRFYFQECVTLFSLASRNMELKND